MSDYIVVCHTEKHAAQLFDSLVAYMRRKNLIFRASRTDLRIQSIEPHGYRVRFMGCNRYWDLGQRGFHGSVVYDRIVEKFLDDNKED